MKRDSKKYLFEHSQAKVTLLEKYLQKYLNIISHDGYTEKISLCDLFCGEGIYDNGGVGSPIVTLQVVKNLFYQMKSKDQSLLPIDIIFNDIDAEKIEKLKSVITDMKLHYSEMGNLKLFTENYQELLPKVQEFVTSLRNQKAFIFIDPYGYREIRASHIKDLLLSGKAEVLLFLPTQFMYRFDENGTPQALIEIVEELTDGKSWSGSKSVYHFIEKFTFALREFLGTNYFVDTFTIQKDANTVFCLFFFSSHIRGFEKMLETKWELDEEEGRGFRFERTGNLFLDEKTLEFQSKLEEYLREFRTNAELYFFTLSNGFLPKHINTILKQLESDEKITSEEKKRKNAFYVNYENYRDNPERIKIKLDI